LQTSVADWWLGLFRDTPDSRAERIANVAFEIPSALSMALAVGPANRNFSVSALSR
jgi:hypothetical protein